ncbi:MAG: AAA family ATPase [Candidatus Baltobacteraceae bacterium]
MPETLRKLIEIRELGPIVSLAAQGNVEWRKLTIIYGLNGSGKSTICAILRSLATEDPSNILSRRRLGASGPSVSRLLSSGGTTHFDGAAWNRANPDIKVFDEYFIDTHLYLGHRAETEQRRNLYHLIVGADAVSIAREIEDLDHANRDALARQQQAEANVRRSCGGINIDEYLAVEPDEEIDRTIQELERQQRDQSDADAIRGRPGLIKLGLPPSPRSILDLLESDGEAVDAAVAIRIDEHVERFGVGKPWLSEGTNHVVGGACPFCEQQVNGAGIVGMYRLFFDVTYGEFEQRIERELRRVSETWHPSIDQRVCECYRQNEEVAAGWSHRIGEPFSPGLSIDAIAAGCRRLADALIRSLTEKRENLTAVPPTAPHLREQMKNYENILVEIERYNQDAEEFNQKITQFKAGLSTENAAAIAQRLTLLRAKKSRFDPESIEACDELIRARSERTTYEAQKVEARARLGAQEQQTLRRCQESVNQYLEAFGCEARVGIARTNITGVPQSKLQICVSGGAIEIGREPAGNQPSIKTLLSAGDRSALALAFFLADIDGDENIADRIVVFDDPFTSQDSARRARTIENIDRISGIAAQVVVTSHDRAFVADLCRRTGQTRRNVLELTRPSSSQHVLQQLDVDELLRTEHMKRVRRAHAFVTEGVGNHNEIYSDIRLIAEEYCRNCQPHLFQHDATLGQMCDVIEAKGTSNPLYEKLPKLRSIGGYANQAHHAEGPFAPDINPEEVKTYARDTLRLIGTLS